MKIETLGNLIGLTKGKKHPETDDINATRYLQIEDVNGADNLKFTYEKGVQVNSDDIILVWDGANAGKVGIGLNGVIGSTLSRMSIDTKSVYPKYLYWFLQSKFDFIKSQRNGATIPHVSTSSINTLPIPIFDLSDQQRIATILDNADSIRRKNKQILEKYNDLVQSVFYEMFGDPITNSKGWPLISLAEICQKITDGTHQAPKFVECGIPFLFVSNIINYEINYNTTKFITENNFVELTKSTPIEVGDILYTTVGSYGNPAIVKSEKKFCFQRHIAHIKPNTQKTNVGFLHAMMMSPLVKRQADQLVRGVAQKTLNLKELKSIQIFNPPMELQSRFQVSLEQIDNQKVLAKLSLGKSEDLFQSLLQRAFKGEL